MKKLLSHILVLIGLLSCYRSQAQVVDAPSLHCVSVDNNGDVVLTWSLPVVNCGPFTAYYIYRSQNINGPYTLVATILNQAQTTYTDNVGNGGITTYFYYMESDFNCPGFTFAKSDTLDNLDPFAPEINYVTVTNGQAEINWQPSASPEAYGYIVYRMLNGNFISIDTVYGKFNNDYIDVNSTPGTDSMSYSLATIDSCINTGPINEKPQHTIYLTDSVVRCEQKIILSWYAYDHWQKGIQKYDVQMSRNGGPYLLMQTLPSNVLTYTVSGFDDGDSVCFRIVAKENITGYVSTSNTLCEKVNVVQPVSDFYVRNVTVIAPGKIAIRYSLNPLSDVKFLKISRGADTTTLSQLATIPPPFDFSVVNEYIDTSAKTDAVSYTYQLMAIDSCGDSTYSTRGSSIWLKGYAFTDLTFYITWTPSWLDSAVVQQYDVYRKDLAGFNFQSSLLPAELFYQEKDIPVDTPCYYVEAIDSMHFANGLLDTIHSRSNVVCLNQPSEIFMPNAFAPLGENNIFKPILNLQGLKSYSFSVYNRWGEQLFYSKVSSEGWDGKYKGVYVQQGAYAYVVSIVDGNGKQVDAKGTVMVIR